MRGSLLIASLLAMSAPAVAEPGPTYVTIGSDALSTAAEVASADHARLWFEGANEGANDGVVVLGIEAGELDHLSQAMHARHDRCGGFIVHDSLAEARAAAAPPVPRPPIAYTIDRGDVVGAVLPRIREDEILATIRALSSRKNRYYRSESGAAVAAWLRDRWRGFTDRTDVTVELFDQGYPQKSVILTIPGTSRPDEVVVIGGHLDSIALGGTAADAPGADDDASGIATLDHVARTLLAADFRPERTIQFMAYAAEEVGLRGSQAIVRDYRRRGVNVVGVLQLDMTNFQGSDRDIWLIDDFTSPAQNQFLAALIERYTTATWGVDRCGYACSDHASWHRAGVPASMPHETRSRDRNKQIHTARDTLEVSHDNAVHAAKFARLGVAYAIELAKGRLGPAARSPKAAIAVVAAPPGAPIGPWRLAGMVLAAAALIGLTRNEMKRRSGTMGVALISVLILGGLSARELTVAAADPAAGRKLNAHFPDFGFMVSPAEYRARYAAQPVFRLKTDFPLDKPTKLPAFLQAIDFKKNPQQYIEAVRDYAFDGNLPDWDPYKNTKADWYHIPWLHPDLAAYPPNGGTEGFHGLIKEAGISPFQLGPDQKGKPNSYSIYAITLVNDLAGYTLGRMWADPQNPDPSVTDARFGGGFPVGTVFAKLLFTDAPQGTDKVAYLENPLQWDAYITTDFQQSTKRVVTKVNLLQMDIAVRDARADAPGLTGWVFGTFVYNGQLNQKNKFMNLVPVGLTWGNDPQDRTNTTTPFPPIKTQVNPKLTQTAIFDAKNLPPQHLGWNGRLNGPADLNTTSCMSCHITAQYPQVTSLVPQGAVPDGGKTPPAPSSWNEWMKWFQNVRCATSMDPRSYSTDFSFQVAISLTNFFEAKQIAGLMADQYMTPKGAAQAAHAPAAPPIVPAAAAAKGIDLTVPHKPIARDGGSK